MSQAMKDGAADLMSQAMRETTVQLTQAGDRGTEMLTFTQTILFIQHKRHLGKLSHAAEVTP